MTYFLDTNVIYYEVLRGFEYSDTKNLKCAFENFAAKCGIEIMNVETLKEAAKQYAILKRNGITIDDDDILIGSLAMERNGTLVTNNTKHFIHLKGIQLENWID